MAREGNIFGVTTGIYTVGIGASLALLVQGAPGEGSSTVKYFSGGSLEIIGIPVGTTTVPTAGTGYLFGNGEVVNIAGAARYWLVATGATAIAYFAKGLTQGY